MEFLSKETSRTLASEMNKHFEEYKKYQDMFIRNEVSIMTLELYDDDVRAFYKRVDDLYSFIQGAVFAKFGESYIPTKEQIKEIVEGYIITDVSNKSQISVR